MIHCSWVVSQLIRVYLKKDIPSKTHLRKLIITNYIVQPELSSFNNEVAPNLKHHLFSLLAIQDVSGWYILTASPRLTWRLFFTLRTILSFASGLAQQVDEEVGIQHTVDGSQNPADHQGWWENPIIYEGFNLSRWLFGISSINSIF